MRSWTASRVIRTYIGETKKAEKARRAKKKRRDPNLPSLFTIAEGLNRKSWDLREETITRVPGLYVFGRLQGRKVVPGTYTVRLTVGETSQSHALEVVPDPRLDVTVAQYREQAEFTDRVEDDLDAIHAAVNRLRGVRGQLKQLAKRTGEGEEADKVRAAVKGISENLTKVEDALIQKRTVDGQTVINFPVRLNHHYIYLLGVADGASGGVVQGARRAFEDLSAKWAEQKAILDDLLGEKLDALNALVHQAEIPAVTAKEQESE